jgi:hypothetical protein
VTCDPDCGSPSLDGKTLEVTALDISIVRCCVHGGLDGHETVDSCDRQFSAETEAILSKGTVVGLREPSGRLSLVTHSGSEWEIAYESLEIREA